MTYATKTQRGFSLMELMFTVAVMAVLLSLAIPSFIETINNNRVIAQNNDFVTSLNYARSEALKRVATVTVCASTNATTCSGSGVLNWATGWIAFADLNADGLLNGADPLLQAWPATGNNMLLTATTRNYVRYGSNGVALTETFSLKKSGCTGNKARQITISPTGRVATTTVAC